MNLRPGRRSLDVARIGDQALQVAHVGNPRHELPPDRVAQIGYDGLMRGKRVVVAGTGNRIAVFLMRFVPHALLLRAVAQRSSAARE